MKNKSVHYIDLGKIGYKNAWELQEQIFNSIISKKLEQRNMPVRDENITQNYLLFCEHEPVYTLGKSGNISNLILEKDTLQNTDTQFFHINRGGDITFHGPGQLVAYPILDLDNFFTDIHLYLRTLEEAVIQTCAEYSVEAGRIPGLTGVWVGHDTPNPRKICAMGIRTSRWVTMHGLALNVHTDISYYDHIIPCGIPDKKVTSLHLETNTSVQMSDVKMLLLEKLSNLFSFEINHYQGNILNTMSHEAL
ncbi:MAG: lipoyl(octanoyl) transferase LipB [Cytophagales bacterium]|nr:lipoyl(octanoyl) transferase LipB [Cytophagales bacterium]